MQILQHLGSVCDDPTLLFTNVADKAHLIIDVVMVHEFHGVCDDIGRQGALRHAQNPDRVLIDAAKRKVSNCSPARGSGIVQQQLLAAYCSS